MATEKRQQRDRRRQAVSMHRVLVSIVFVGILALVVWGLVALWRAPLFPIRHVEVSGATHLSQESILASASVPADATLLKLPSSEIEKRLLAAPWIAEVRISRSLPDTLKIAVVERVAAAVVRSGTAMWLVSADGFWLEQHSAVETFAVPAVVDVSGLAPVAGERISSPEVTNVLSVLRGLSPDLSTRIVRISAASVDKTTIILTGPIEVVVGEADDIAKKDQIVRGILAGQKNVVYIDVRLVDKPTWRGLGK
ncbi:MAG: FtsQ-type POTRA domain-containing protein [Coriobacteriia bacterium]|nr:FtsQ-type POTRA domain-containing protein [Coriobacteriia bacterium]